MRLIKKFGEAEFQVQFHKWATVFWFLAAFPICIFLSSSIPFLVFISVYAIVTGHWASYEAACAEVEQKKQTKRMDSA